MSRGFLGVVSFLWLASHSSADPLTNWTWRFPSPQANILTAVTYGGGKFVAVGDNGTVVTSTDGYHWANQSSGISIPLRGVAYADGEYAAVGDSGVMIVSPDAKTWLSLPVITTNLLRGVAGADGGPYQYLPQFLAVGDNGTILECNGNTNWSALASGTTNSLYGVTCVTSWDYTVVGANGTIIGIDNTGVYPDAPSDIGTSGNLHAVENNGTPKYAAGGDLNVNPLYSSSTTDEILYSKSFDLTWTNEEWLNGIAVSPTNQTLWYLSQSFIVNGIAGGPSGFAAVGYTGYDLEYHPAVVLTSAKGTNWNELPSSTCENGLNSIAYGGLYVAVGDFGSIAVSPDLATWSEVTLDRRGFIVSMAVNPHLWIATAMPSFYSWNFPDFDVIVSTDGVNWTASENMTNFPSLIDLAASSSNFVGVAGNSTFATSDGFHWHTNSPSTNALHGVNFVNGRFFALGDNGSIFSSSDGSNWVACPAATTNSLTSVAYGQGLYVAAGSVAATSVDGTNWAVTGASLSAPLTRLVYGQGQFIGISYTGTILTSPDGVTWVGRFTEPNGEGLSGIAYSGGLFLAISGNSGFTYKSTDGIHWVATGSSLPMSTLAYDLGTYGYRTQPMPLGLHQYYQSVYPRCYSSLCSWQGTFLMGGAEGTIQQSGNTWTSPVIASTQLADDQFSFSYTQQVDVPYRIQSSTNLISWTNLYSGTGSGQLTNFTVQITPPAEATFYRLVSP